jgi:steroid 5-alpha reductase family enzyme
MDNSSRNAIIGVPVILVLAALIAWAGSQGGAVVFGIPLFALCVALAFIIQWLVFIPSYIFQTEKYFDLTGSITYLSLVWAAVLLSPVRDARSWLVAGLVSIWAIRLGSFLFMRIRAAGEDTRFRELKTSFPRFLLVWTLQGLWVSLTLAAGLAAVTTSLKLELGLLALIGLVVWLLGFGIEVTADRQKSRFRELPENKGKFINTGLWSWSRHPNYFGEIVLWIGIALIAIPVLQGWQYATLISPIFVILLLTRISGIPLLERQADERWGGQPEYEEYKSKTSILIPLPPSSAK